MKGITFQTFAQWSERLLKVEPTLENLKALTDRQAAVLYKVLYWDRVHGDEVGTQWLANIICDFYVHNPRRGATTLQQVINRQGHTPKLAVDGYIGPLTMAGLHSFPHATTYKLYREARAAFYESLKDSHAVFIRGWRNRMKRFPQTLEES